MSKEIKAAIICVIGAVISAIIGAYFGVNFERNVDKEATVFNVYETDEYLSLQREYEELNSQYIVIKQENTELQNKINSLDSTNSTYSTLNNENKALKDENKLLKEEIDSLKEEINSSEYKVLYAQAIDDNVRIYNKPDYDSEVMTSINKGDKLQVIEITYDINKNKWFKININKVTGFISSEDVDIVAE